jgi:hypothetical protein
MKSKFFIFALLTIFIQQTFSQTYPTFGTETKVTITGLTFDAMEPFISLDGNTLFFNSLNSGGNTNLYYATKINDTTFTYVGLVGGTYDPSPDHLDGVASLDSLNNFFWVSVRNFPNLQRGTYLAGSVNNITRTFGDFNIFTPGWIIMDAAINYQGNLLYYCNAYFGPTFTECPGVPCEAKLGVAQKVNDSTFNKLINTNAIFSNVNDTNYIIYAPQVTKDGLELYFTRILKNTINSEICLSVRNSITDNFSLPTVIHSNLGFIPEAASPTTDKQKIYYHQKDGTGIFHIYIRYRTVTTGINEQTNTNDFKVYPNPTNNILNIILPKPSDYFTISVYSSFGQELFKASNKTSIDISNLPKGIYFLTVKNYDRIWTTKIVKE